MKNILITGGAGFMGSHFVQHVLSRYPDYRVVVVDKLTYAGNLDNLAEVSDHPSFTFVRGDICDAGLVQRVMGKHRIDAIVNFAAETHVDRSLIEAGSFVQTDVFGSYVLLEAAKAFSVERYLQISTDEVYGALEVGSADESYPVNPRSPYSASKLGA